MSPINLIHTFLTDTEKFTEKLYREISRNFQKIYTGKGIFYSFSGPSTKQDKQNY